MIHIHLNEQERDLLISCIWKAEQGAAPEAYLALNQLHTKIASARNFGQQSKSQFQCQWDPTNKDRCINPTKPGSIFCGKHADQTAHAHCTVPRYPHADEVEAYEQGGITS